MPIRFRCSHCGQLLSITRRKAGLEVTCPQCVTRIKVPKLEQTVAAASDRAMTAQQPEVTEAPEESQQLQVVSEQQTAASAALPESAWKHHPNPWKDGDEEEEEFALGRQPLQEAGLDMTPMVDVTFLLLIFFMITASFSTQKSMQTTPPEPDEEGASATVVMQELEEESIVVEINENNELRVDDTPVAGLGELTDVLRAKASEGRRELLIEAHPNATHGMVVGVSDAGLEAEMQKIRRASTKGDD